MTFTTTLPLLTLFTFTACADAPVSLATTEQGLKFSDGGCPVWGCGSNSPVIDALSFHELNEVGVRNAEGFRVVRFEKKDASNIWRSYRADVIDGALVARNRLTGAIVFGGSALVGARFVLTNDETGLGYYLNIAAVAETPFWAHDHVQAAASTYRFTWQWSATYMRPLDICGAATENDGIQPFHAVVFDDDRVDADAIAVVGESRNWFNIGCKSHALAKQHLTGHTKAAGTVLGLATTLGDRTANLKMLSADYCGNGTPFTVPGQPLTWRDEHGWYSSIQGGTLEARWSERGADCLNVPRVDANPTTDSEATFPETVEKLLGEEQGYCTGDHVRPPPCTGDETDFQGAHLVSVNP